MLDAVQRLLASFMIRVRVNRLQESLVDDRAVIVKTRRRGAGVVIVGGNAFLMLSQSGVRMFVCSRRWSTWETYCSRLLYPEMAAGCVASRRSAVLAKLPGTSLRRLLLQQQDSLPAVVAGVQEVYRCHQIHCRRFGGPWSHGDLHLDNVLYDTASGRAFLIDFDAHHMLNLPGLDRHADDLVVMLLELIALAGDRWRPLANAVLERYPNAAVLACVAERLDIPSGLAKILFHIRTCGLPTTQIETRVLALRYMVQRLPRTTTAAGCRLPGEPTVVSRLRLAVSYSTTSLTSLE
jgi:hypothetical protein